MEYTTVYVGMDVHKESFSLACYTNEKEEAEYVQRTEAHYSKVLSYLEAMRFHYGDDVTFICGYEAGCLGYTLYHQLTSHHVKCVILAKTSMPTQKGKKKVKTDKRDAQKINTTMSRLCQGHSRLRRCFASLTAPCPCCKGQSSLIKISPC